ncbi:NAD-dependent epimerase/dehydratase family protein [Moritella yayanosii]|uniref:NAD dependent epimerase/dehydratase family protein n=1 Tax=Moritella yayanosii TaxID=69539 RepID=A0A330LU48_9GAMM|nr:NAD(P)-dependent oxidoreductase [Moritella yayanosii]SQD79776.1 NAD dependent epimerase/dehydratase family protein [Moritella yayanosii]
MATIIIFGGSGFIGTHLSHKLISDDYNVIIIDLNKPRFSHEQLTYIKCDVRDLSKLDINVPIERIYNFAAVHTTPGHPTHEYYDTNIAGASSVCELAEKHDVNEIIFTSSISVYGPDEEQKDENTELTPNSAYGYSKMLAEKIHKSWYKSRDNRKLTIVRPAVVFGPGEGGNFTRLATMMGKGIFIYPGRKNTIKACIYVEDLISAIESARYTDNSFELFNGAYPERYTLENIIECFKKNHFPNVKLFMVPKQVVLCAASLFKIVNFLNIGIHPDRVMKLIRSTNIYPSWIVENEIQLPGDLESALQRWSDSTNGRFD